MCGRGINIGNSGAQCANCSSLRALNLEMGATEKEVKSAYRGLVKVWHPDLFEGDRLAQVIAEEKLQTISTAFRLLSSQPCNDSGRETCLEYFTIGSTRTDVLAVQGIPTGYSPDTFEYGASKVFFVGDKVVGWENAPVWVHLKVQLLPAHPVDGKMHYISKGSTKDEVLAIQGTPTGFSYNAFEYGTSKVHFKDGRVTSWDSAPGWVSLRVQFH